MKCIKVEIKKSFRKNCFHLRLGDLSDALEARNISKEQVIGIIKDEMKKLRRKRV